MSLNATTIAGALGVSDNQVTLASGTGAAVGKLLKVGTEKMRVLNVDNSPSLRVSRGQNGTAAQAHTSGARAVLGLSADFPPEEKPADFTYTTAGALQVKAGIHKLKTGTAGAMTLRDPLASEEGLVMEIVALDAQAYTVEYVAGFKAGTTSNDLLTFGGAIGDRAVIQVVNGIFNIVSLQGVTVG